MCLSVSHQVDSFLSKNKLSNIGIISIIGMIISAGDAGRAEQNENNMNYVKYNVGEAAKLVGFPGGRNKFFKWLRDNGFLDSRNCPVKKYEDKGWFGTNDLTITAGWFRWEQPVTGFTSHGLVEIGKIVREQFKDIPAKCRKKKSNINSNNPNSIIEKITVHKTNINHG